MVATAAAADALAADHTSPPLLHHVARCSDDCPTAKELDQNVFASHAPAVACQVPLVGRQQLLKHQQQTAAASLLLHHQPHQWQRT